VVFILSAIHDYFLGATSPNGFSGFFEQLVENDAPFRTYIIKGGPGCGKSSLMRRIADRIIANGHDLEMIHCSSDPLSLDGLICYPLRFAIVDGTAPHVLEPSIPAAKQEVVSLYHCIDNARMQLYAESLMALFAQNAHFSTRAKRFVAAAGSLHFDIERTARNCLIAEKAKRYARNLCARIMPRTEGTGSESLRLCGAVTPLGIVDYAEDNYARCDHVHIFEDRYGAAAHLSLETIRDFALEAGYDIITSRSFLSPYDAIEAVYIPALSLAFLHSSYISLVRIDHAHVIRDRRFYDAAALSLCQRRLGFCKKAVLEMLGEAGSLLADAKAVHDDIEEYYKSSVDFVRVREREKEICVDLGLEP
jgi:hypothetical protein